MIKKTLLLSLPFFLIATPLFSDCASGFLSFWPMQKNISKNPIFLIEGFDASQKIIEELGNSNKVYLKCGDKKVNLYVQKILVGEFSLTQAILRPEGNLIANQEYELVIEDIYGEGNLAVRYLTNSRIGKNETVKWIVSEGTDLIPPTWKSIPVFEKNEFDMFGCGSRVFVNFKCSVNETSDCLALTTVKNLTTGKRTSYCLIITNGSIFVGHEMCFGAFDFADGNKFELEFTLMDASGNFTAWEGEKLKFDNPTKG